ncbi:hypothetical protein C7967_11551 [Thalassospira sp. 11-3]|nr:hypothetical protein C7967_11551 [Thalassospira sp. 11-3]
MSWKDSLKNNPFRIKTGDGKEYRPLWISGERTLEFNAAVYDFIDVSGSLVDRKKPKSTKYPLVFYFQGDDNVAQSKLFETSAKDNRAWEVNHPFYGTITGQPLAIAFDDSAFNITKITVDFWETITQDYPNTKTSARDTIIKKVGVLNALGVSNYTSGAKPESADIFKIKENNTDVAAKFNFMQTKDTLVSYKNAVSKAAKSVDNLIASPGDVIQNNQQLLLLPSTYDRPVKDRLNALKLAYMEIKSIITGKNDKYYFESQAATTLSGISQAATDPQETDYITRDQVSESTELILEVYNDYLETVDNAQVDQYDVDNSWSPNGQLQTALYDLVTETIAGLYGLAFGAKQERIVETATETNLFLLTHKYMGLDPDDENLETFRTINNIQMDELFKIAKGRKIKYFV